VADVFWSLENGRDRPWPSVVNTRLVGGVAGAGSKRRNRYCRDQRMSFPQECRPTLRVSESMKLSILSSSCGGSSVALDDASKIGTYLAGLDVLERRKTAFGLCAPAQIVEHSLAYAEVERIPRGLIEVIRRLDEFWSSRPPRPLYFPLLPDPSFRQRVVFPP
jgi:hypothetical protein